MTTHDLRRVRLHVATDTIHCFNCMRPLTGNERADVLARTAARKGLRPDEVIDALKALGGWHRLVGLVRQWVSERIHPVRCVG